MSEDAKNKDVVIVGAGPAGLSAAIYTRLDQWSTLVLESDWIGGQGAIAWTVANYPGYAPGSDANDPERYAEFVASRIGVPADVPLVSLSPPGPSPGRPGRPRPAGRKA